MNSAKTIKKKYHNTELSIKKVHDIHKNTELSIKKYFYCKSMIYRYICKNKLNLDLFFKKKGHNFYNPYIEKKTLYEIGQ